jgi:hypothetical protein
MPMPLDPDEWRPATSRPGELYTVEGEARARWAFLGNLRARDARSRVYRREMLSTGLLLIGLAGLVVLAAALVVSLI